MADDTLIVQKPVRMAMWRVARMKQIADNLHVSDDAVIERALDLFFAAATLLDAGTDGAPGNERAEQSLATDVLKRLQEEADFYERDRQPVPPPSETGFVPIEIKGKPLSETIIEERRLSAFLYLDTSASRSATYAA
jgi:hypothetical protein